MEVGRKKTKGHGACDLVFGKRFCSKNLRATVLAIWALGRGSFQNSRGTVLAIECLGRIFKKKLRGTALAIWDLGRVSFQSKLRDTVLAIMGV